MHAGSPSYATAELAWGLVIAAMREIPVQVESLRSGRWQAGVGWTLRGKRSGSTVTAGSGRSWRATARPSEWMWSCGPVRNRLSEHVRTDSRRRAAARRSSRAVHMRLVEATHGLITAADLDLMKPTALFVNTSRAGLVEPGALVRALATGRPGMAALDVFEQEPMVDRDHPCSGCETSSAHPTSATSRTRSGTSSSATSSTRSTRSPPALPRTS